MGFWTWVGATGGLPVHPDHPPSQQGEGLWTSFWVLGHACPHEGCKAFFETGFEDSDWIRSSTSRAGVSSHTANSGSQSLFTRYGSVSVTSRDIDTSTVNSVTVSYWVRRGSDAFSEDPDPGEDLVAEYYSSAGSWVQLAYFSGGYPYGEIFNRNIGEESVVGLATASTIHIRNRRDLDPLVGPHGLSIATHKAIREGTVQPQLRSRPRRE